MTRLPTESWAVVALTDMPPYKLNTVCPVTGDTFALEDHHIWRRSFTAIGPDVWWVKDGVTVYPNRIALSHEAHRRITENRARLEFRGAELFYIEGEEERKLEFDIEAAPQVKPRNVRKKAAKTPDERRKSTQTNIKTPQGEQNVIPELLDLIRDRYEKPMRKEMGWSGTVGNYHIVVYALWKLAEEGFSVQKEAGSGSQ